MYSKLLTMRAGDWPTLFKFIDTTLVCIVLQPAQPKARCPRRIESDWNSNRTQNYGTKTNAAVSCKNYLGVVESTSRIYITSCFSVGLLKTINCTKNCTSVSARKLKNKYVNVFKLLRLRNLLWLFMSHRIMFGRRKRVREKNEWKICIEMREITKIRCPTETEMELWNRNGVTYFSITFKISVVSDLYVTCKHIKLELESYNFQRNDSYAENVSVTHSRVDTSQASNWVFLFGIYFASYTSH